MFQTNVVKKKEAHILARYKNCVTVFGLIKQRVDTPELLCFQYVS
jgi:hypothetical protein